MHRGVNTEIGLSNLDEFDTHGVNTLSIGFSHLVVLTDVAEVGFPVLFRISSRARVVLSATPLALIELAG